MNIFEFNTEKAVLGTSFKLVAGILLLTPENREMTAAFETVNWHGPTTKYQVVETPDGEMARTNYQVPSL